MGNHNGSRDPKDRGSRAAPPPPHHVLTHPIPPHPPHTDWSSPSWEKNRSSPVATATGRLPTPGPRDVIVMLMVGGVARGGGPRFNSHGTRNGAEPRHAQRPPPPTTHTRDSCPTPTLSILSHAPRVLSTCPSAVQPPPPSTPQPGVCWGTRAWSSHQATPHPGTQASGQLGAKRGNVGRRAGRPRPSAANTEPHCGPASGPIPRTPESPHGGPGPDRGGGAGRPPTSQARSPGPTPHPPPPPSDLRPLARRPPPPPPSIVPGPQSCPCSRPGAGPGSPPPGLCPPPRPPPLRRAPRAWTQATQPPPPHPTPHPHPKHRLCPCAMERQSPARARGGSLASGHSPGSGLVSRALIWGPGQLSCRWGWPCRRLCARLAPGAYGVSGALLLAPQGFATWATWP